jgi:hypothetical protein
LKYFLGIKLAYSHGNLKETRKLRCKLSSTHVDSKKKLSIEEETPLENINQYQRLVEKLIYLTVNGPDLAYVVSEISQFMHAPKPCHLEVICVVQVRVSYRIRCGCSDIEKIKNTGYDCGYI